MRKRGVSAHAVLLLVHLDSLYCEDRRALPVESGSLPPRLGARAQTQTFAPSVSAKNV
jgi:hypothetical protein